MLVVGRNSLAVAVLVLLAGVPGASGDVWSVDYTSQNVCGLKGASISLSCTYKYPTSLTVSRSIWFIEDHFNKEPVDLREYEEYKGRVRYIQNEQNKCGLIIDDLRDSDAKTYKFRFYTQDPTGRFTGTPGVTLTVTDLKVTRSHRALTCSTSAHVCTLLNVSYVWYRNGQDLYNNDKRYYLGQETGNYYCAIKGHENLHSTTLCVSDYSCRSVTYTNKEICALVGSSVTIKGYYTYYNWQLYPEPTWYKQRVKLSPVTDRVEISTGDTNWHKIRLINVTVQDSASYKLIIMSSINNNVIYDGNDHVSLTVTDLNVTITSKSPEQNLTLTCTSFCILPNNPTYIWYKNAQQINECKHASCTIKAANDASYRCAVKGHENLLSHPVYPPKNTSAVILPSKELEVGGLVTLTCSCLGANPPVLGYSWFKREANADRRVQDGQQNYSIINVSSRDTGFYYCAARNKLGQQHSSVIHLDVLHPPKNTTVMVISSEETTEGSTVTLVCHSHANPPVQIYRWFEQGADAGWSVTTAQNYTIANISSNHSGFYYCTAFNRLGQQDSKPVFLNVVYAPRVPLLTKIPSASASSITIRCGSDANPAGSYSWYRKTQSDEMYIRNGTDLTVDAGDSRVYYCIVRNRLGSLRSVEWSTWADNHAHIYTAVGCVVVILLIILAAVLWRKGTVCAATLAAAGSTNTAEENSGQDPAPIYCNVSDLNSTRMSFADDQADILYSSVQFTCHPPLGRPLNSALEKPLVPEGEVEYAVVSLTQPRAAQSDTIYSTVQRT